MLTEKQVSNEFLNSLKKHDSLPYLFIGSGLSKRYLQLPDWRSLLEVFSEKAGLNFSRLTSECNQDLKQVAEKIAIAFHDIWWESNEFRSQRDDCPDPTNPEHVLKIAVSCYLKKLQETAQKSKQQDHELKKMGKVTVDGVITTNYDTLLEQVFPEFDPYIGQDELLLGDAQFIGEIYKIHGSLTDPSSMVLTTRDYEEIENKNQYLAAKLLTIFAEHPVIFVGYSLNDDYITQILGDIVKAVGSRRLQELGSRIYFVSWNNIPDSSPILSLSQIDRGGQLLPITEIKTHSFEWIWESLGQLERTFPAKTLRALKKKVYELVVKPDPGDEFDRVKAISIDSEEATHQRVVFGVTDMTDQQLPALSEFGTRTITRADLEKDLVGLSDFRIPAKFVLQTGIVDQIRANARWFLPVWKYIAEDQRILEDGKTKLNDLHGLIQEIAYRETPPLQYRIPDRYKQEFTEPVTVKKILGSDKTVPFKMNCVRLFLRNGGPAKEVRDGLKDWLRSDLGLLENTDTRKALFELDRSLYRPQSLEKNI